MAPRTLDIGFSDSPRTNVVAVGVLLGSLMLGGLVALAVRNPIPIIAMAVVGAIAVARLVHGIGREAARGAGGCEARRCCSRIFAGEQATGERGGAAARVNGDE